MTAEAAGPPFVVGHKVSFSKTISDEDIRKTAEASGDTNPLHLDDAYAAKTRFKQRIAHGVLTSGVISAALGVELPGPNYTTIFLGQTLQYQRPVNVGDTVTANLEVTGVDRRRLTLSTDVVNQSGETVATGTADVLLDPYPRE
jgi:acyl dehydratase